MATNEELIPLVYAFLESAKLTKKSAKRLAADSGKTPTELTELADGQVDLLTIYNHFLATSGTVEHVVNSKKNKTAPKSDAGSAKKAKKASGDSETDSDEENAETNTDVKKNSKKKKDDDSSSGSGSDGSDSDNNKGTKKKAVATKKTATKETKTTTKSGKVGGKKHAEAAAESR